MAALVASENVTAIRNPARSMMVTPCRGHEPVLLRRDILSVSAVAVTAKEVADQNGTVPLHAGQGQPAPEGLDQGESEDGPQDGLLAAEDAGPAENDGGDDVELEPGAHVGARRRDARHEDDRRE